MNRAAELEHYISDTSATVCLAGMELAGFIAPLVGKTYLEQVVVAAYGTYVREPTDLNLPAEVSAEPQPLKAPGLIDEIFQRHIIDKFVLSGLLYGAVDTDGKVFLKVKNGRNAYDIIFNQLDIMFFRVVYELTDVE
jgi:hypothetical protein